MQCCERYSDHLHKTNSILICNSSRNWVACINMLLGAGQPVYVGVFAGQAVAKRSTRRTRLTYNCELWAINLFAVMSSRDYYTCFAYATVFKVHRNNCKNDDQLEHVSSYEEYENSLIFRVWLKKKCVRIVSLIIVIKIENRFLNCFDKIYSVKMDQNTLDQNWIGIGSE